MRKNEKIALMLDEFLDLLEAAVVAFFAFICIFSLFFINVTVDGESMETTLYNGDRLIARKFMFEPERGDIAIIYSESMKEVIVKRVIGISNDRVEIDYSENAVYVNGERISEPYLHEPMVERDSFAPTFKDANTGRYVYRVPFGKYFVLGDNRNHSTDGRVFGFVSTDEIIGRAFLRYSSKKASLGLLN